MKITKKELREIIQEEISNVISESYIDDIKDTLSKVKKEVIRELSKKKVKVRWITDIEEKPALGGKREIYLSGEFENGVVRATGTMDRNGKVYYSGAVFYSSSLFKSFTDPKKFIMYMKKSAQEFKPPTTIGK